jgi:hypothetical protein
MKTLTVALISLAVVLALLGCPDPVSRPSPVEDPEYISIPAGSLGAYGAIEVLQGTSPDNSGAVGVITENLTTPLAEGLNISVPTVPSEAFTITGTAPLPNTQGKSLTVSLNANPGYIFDPDAAYTFSGQSPSVKTAGSLTFPVSYTVVDGTTEHRLDSPVLTNASGNLIGTIALSGGAGTEASPYTGTVEVSSGNNLTILPDKPPRSASANVIYLLTSSATATEATIVGSGTSTVSGLSFDSTSKYLFIKVALASDSTQYTIYRIEVKIADPKPDIISTTPATLGGESITFNGSKSGNSAAEAIEGYVRLINTANAAPSIYMPGIGISYAVNDGSGAPSTGDYSASTSTRNFAANRTLWIRTQYPASGDPVSTRYYKVRVILDPQELKDPFLTSSSGLERPIYLSSGKSGDSVANAIEGNVTFPGPVTGVSLGTSEAPSNYSRAGLLVSDDIPAANTITGGNPFTLGNTNTILWVRIASWEEDSSSNPVSYKYYKIAITVTAPSPAEDFISTYGSNFSGVTLVQLSNDTVQVKGSVDVLASLTPSRHVHLYVDEGGFLGLFSSSSYSNVTFHAQGYGGSSGRTGTLRYHTGSLWIGDITTGTAGWSVSTGGYLSDLADSYTTVDAGLSLSLFSISNSSSTSRNISIGGSGNIRINGELNYHIGNNAYIGVRVSGGSGGNASVQVGRQSGSISSSASGSYSVNCRLSTASGDLGVNVDVPVNVTWQP